MNGLWQSVGRKSFRQRVGVLLVLTCWTIQAIFYWSTTERQRVDAAQGLGSAKERCGIAEMSLEQLKELRESIREHTAVAAKGQSFAGKADDSPDREPSAPEDNGPEAAGS